MKNIIRNILFLAVTALYVFSTMGYGVHKCTLEGTASLTILFAENPCWNHGVCGHEAGCSYGHHNEGKCAESGICSDQKSCEEHDSNSHSHSGNCCSTDVYVLSQDQTTVQDDYDIHIPMVDTFLAAPYIQELVADAQSLSFKLGTADKEMPVEDIQQALLCTFMV